MARPKGSKNKTTVEQEPINQQADPVTFNYEDDDAKFDSNYQQRFDAAAAYAMSMPAVVGQFDPTPRPIDEANTFKVTGGVRLFLVEGEVQLASRAPGRGAMVAKQMRLVEAADEMQAINKYVGYFNGLSDAQSAYTVINAAAMETIK